MTVLTQTMQAPPTYEQAVSLPYRTNPSSFATTELSHQTRQISPFQQQSTQSGLVLPAVIPQTSKSFRGANFSPFIRAYAPSFAAHGIDKATFVAFIDGLNEAFIASPAFQATSMVGGVMGMCYGVHPVQIAGTALQFASGAASAATSYARTKAYVKAVNTDLFHPAGLQVTIVGTKDMMKRVRYPQDRLQLPPLEELSEQDSASYANIRPKQAAATVAAAAAGHEDARMRRLRALEGYVAPLDYDVPEQVMPDNLLRKMGAAQAARMEKKQNKKFDKDRREGREKYFEKSREAESKQREGDKEVAKLEAKLAKERTKLEKEYSRRGEKAQRDFDKAEAQIRKEIDRKIAQTSKEVGKQMKEAHKERSKGSKKEGEIAQKIRWVVITTWRPNDLEPVYSEDAITGNEDSEPDVEERRDQKQW